MKYTLQVGDECIVAPLSLFHTELLNITGPGKLARTQKPSRQQPDPEDCFDAEYLRETGVCMQRIFQFQTQLYLSKCPLFVLAKRSPRANGSKYIRFNGRHDEH